MSCQFVPGYLLDRLADADEEAASRIRATRDVDASFRASRAALATHAALADRPSPRRETARDWEVYTANNTSTLPGELVRSTGQSDSGDRSVDEAAAGVTATLALLTDYGQASYDDDGATVVATVHYERDYVNAFWDGTQLVFGDGDGKVFDRFTKPIEVLGHELAHAVVQHTAGLEYANQPGALNESVADVIGACVKQRVLRQDAASADWLIGQGIFLPGVKGRALRSMAAPGTAYDDPALGRDRQVGHMSDYVETSEDNGGVHINSGIPNKAFQVAATAIGGASWKGAGRIWWAALTSGIGARTDFTGFAEACIAAAGEHADAVRDAWEQVGVLRAAGSADPAPSPGPDAGRQGQGRRLTVRRTGGLAGMVKEGTVDLAAEDEVATRARELYEQVDLTAVGQLPPQPDRYVYCFDCPPDLAEVGEPDLTPELSELAHLVLERPER